MYNHQADCLRRANRLALHRVSNIRVLYAWVVNHIAKLRQFVKDEIPSISISISIVFSINIKKNDTTLRWRKYN